MARKRERPKVEWSPETHRDLIRGLVVDPDRHDDDRRLPRRGSTNVRTKLAHQRLRHDLTQREIAELTGIPLGTYRRLEQGAIDNPPLRHLVNCALVLRVQVGEIIEDDWLKWKALDPTAAEPPKWYGHDWHPSRH